MEYKQEQLRSTLDTQYYELPEKPNVQVPVPAANARERKQREITTFTYEPESPPSILTFKLTDLHPTTTEFDLRRLFDLVHVVKIDVETDNITGVCRGSALVQVRSHLKSKELETARNNIVRAGFEIQDYVPEVKKRSQYVELSGRNFLDSMTESVRNGYHQYETPRDTDMEWKREQEQLHRWTQMRKTDIPVRSSSTLTTGSRLLQPTVSSTERTRYK